MIVRFMPISLNHLKPPLVNGIRLFPALDGQPCGSSSAVIVTLLASLLTSMFSVLTIYGVAVLHLLVFVAQH